MQDAHKYSEECWPIFDAGDQQGCDFNSVEFDTFNRETQTMPTMRAKMKVTSVTKFGGCEQLKMNAVCKSRYPDDGSDENNTFAKFSPSAELTITIANPALFGKFEPEQQFYVDFTLVGADVAGDFNPHNTVNS